MLFDHNEIVIRERSYLEVLDLALQVVRVHWRGLIVALAAGAIPMKSK